MVLLPCLFIFASEFQLFLSFPTYPNCLHSVALFSPTYEIVSIPTMIVNAYPRDPVPQREYFPTVETKQRADLGCVSCPAVATSLLVRPCPGPLYI